MATTVTTRTTGIGGPITVGSEDRPPAKRRFPPRVPRSNAAPDPETGTPFAKVGDDDPNLDSWLLSLTEDEWSRMIAYLWRCKPIFDRTEGGKPKSVEKYARRFDLDEIMKTHGSGMYRIDFCSIPASGARSVRIRQSYFTIMNMAYPPKLPYGEWVDDPGNKEWKWAGPMLERLEAAATQAAAVPQNSGMEPAQLMDTVFKGMEMLRGQRNDNQELAGSIVSLVRDNQEKMAALTDPARQLTTLKQLIDMVSPKGEDSSANKIMFDFMAEQLRETRAELRAMRERPNPSLLDQIKEIGPVIKDLGGIFGGASARHAGTDWGAVITGVVDKVAESLPSLAILATQGRPQAPHAAPSPNFTPAALPSAAAVPAPLPAAPMPPRPAASAPPARTGEASQQNAEQIEQERQRMMGIIQKHGALMMEVAPFMADAFGASTGYDFRDWFISRKGLEKWNEVKTDIGAERLYALTQMHEVLQTKIAPVEKAMQFFGEFFTVPGEEPEGVRVLENEPEDDEDDENPMAKKAN